MNVDTRSEDDCRCRDGSHSDECLSRQAARLVEGVIAGGKRNDLIAIADENPRITRFLVEALSEMNQPAPPNPAHPFVYAIAAGRSGFVKIGKSISPTRRVRTLQGGHYEELRIIWHALGGYPLEAHLHSAFEEMHVRGEWFDFGDSSDSRCRELLRGAEVGWRTPSTPAAWTEAALRRRLDA